MIAADKQQMFVRKEQKGMRGWEVGGQFRTESTIKEDKTEEPRMIGRTEGRESG